MNLVKSIIISMLILFCWFPFQSIAGTIPGAILGTINNLPAGPDSGSMGNTWVANPTFSTNNPGSVLSLLEYGGEKYNFGASGVYGLISFSQGHQVDMWSTSGVLRLPDNFGAIQLTLSTANSEGEALDGDGVGHLTGIQNVDIKYSVKIVSGLFDGDDSLALGAGYSNTEGKLGLIQMQTYTTNIVTKANSITFGTLYQLADKLAVGGAYGCSFININQNASSEGWSESLVTKDQPDWFRLGARYKILPMTNIAFDFEHSHSDEGNKDKSFIGMEQGIVKNLLYLYGGMADKSWTAGLGVYTKTYGCLNLCYMDDISGEDETLGRAHFTGIMLSGYF